ncbi:MAG: hypothetical protein TU36_001630 [Vulcanisaeta sp. AZ3]|jgi:hypothetical protein|nr:MAG: hypothetical protein TU36_05265 [Vulcanisaeta sp. AZ3]
MSLPIPPEPGDIKDRIMKRRSACTGTGCDSFAVWFGNELAKYLWAHWSKELSRVHINWQRFLVILGNHTQDIINWAIKGTLNWEDLVKIIAGEALTGVRIQEEKGGILDYIR